MNPISLLNLLVILFIIQVITNLILTIDNHKKVMKLQKQFHDERIKYIKSLHDD